MARKVGRLLSGRYSWRGGPKSQRPSMLKAKWLRDRCEKVLVRVASALGVADVDMK